MRSMGGAPPTISANSSKIPRGPMLWICSARDRRRTAVSGGNANEVAIGGSAASMGLSELGAKQGDSIALRLCLERIVPPRKDRPINFALPTITTAADALKATGALIAAVANGDVTPSEAAELSKLVEGFVKSLEITDLAERIAKLESVTTHKSPGK